MAPLLHLFSNSISPEVNRGRRTFIHIFVKSNRGQVTHIRTFFSEKSSSTPVSDHKIEKCQGLHAAWRCAILGTVRKDEPHLTDSTQIEPLTRFVTLVNRGQSQPHEITELRLLLRQRYKKSGLAIAIPVCYTRGSSQDERTKNHQL